MFKEALSYIHILAEHMCEFNPNIEWEEVLMKAKDKTDEQMLNNVIRPKLWVDKSHGEDLDDRPNMHYFMHFTKLFKKYNKVDRLYIVVGEPFDDCPEEFVHLLEKKQNVLERFMKIRMIKTEEKQTHDTYVLPLWYGVHKEDIKGKIIKDNELYTFVISNPVVNQCLLACKLLQLGVDVENIVPLVKKFYFL